jgi:hypothetical protein
MPKSLTRLEPLGQKYVEVQGQVFSPLMSRFDLNEFYFIEIKWGSSIFKLMTNFIIFMILRFLCFQNLLILVFLEV